LMNFPFLLQSTKNVKQMKLVFSLVLPYFNIVPLIS
jgi:hypothetical protein